MWIGGSSDAAVRRTAKYGTGWQAGSETPETVGQVIAAIKDAAAEAGRSIDEDHYGAAFAYRFGDPDDPGVVKAMERYKARTGRDASAHFAFGDADAIVERIARYVENDACKFDPAPSGGYVWRVTTSDRIVNRAARRGPRF